VLKFASSILALLILFSTSAIGSAKPRCLSPDQIISKSSSPLRHRLEGDNLAAFKTNFSIELRKKSPDAANDLLLIFGMPNDDLWIVQGFSKGCRSSTRLTIPDNFKLALYGGTI
jgi:hypothetical protein